MLCRRQVPSDGSTAWGGRLVGCREREVQRKPTPSRPLGAIDTRQSAIGNGITAKLAKYAKVRPRQSSICNLQCLGVTQPGYRLRTLTWYAANEEAPRLLPQPGICHLKWGRVD